MRHNIDVYIQCAWIVLGAIWALGAFSVKLASQAEAPASRLCHLGVLATAFSLLFSPWLRVGVLAAQVVPDANWILYVGFALTVCGLLFAIWARALLGENWSARVTIKEDHSLLRRGPYALVRHPIYSGFLVAMVGTALVHGRVGCLLAVPVGFLAWWTKSRVEEEFLRAQFGEEYAIYQREVRALIPFIL